MFDHLSRRQSEIIELLSQGYADKQVSRDLAIAERTVRTHIERMFAKTGYHSRAAIVAAWLRYTYGASLVVQTDAGSN
jgi:DNA-binding NarL/FixJ family response regulator